MTWSEWTECSLSCGGGSQSRSRSCHGPFFGGSDCSGDESEEQTCNDVYCPSKYLLRLYRIEWSRQSKSKFSFVFPCKFIKDRHQAVMTLNVELSKKLLIPVGLVHAGQASCPITYTFMIHEIVTAYLYL